MANTKKNTKIKLDNIFNEQDIKEISNAIVRAIGISSTGNVNEILQVLKK